MAYIPQCDNCNEIFKGGFIDSLKKVVAQGKLERRDFNIEITIRPPHLCEKCFRKIMREALKKE